MIDLDMVWDPAEGYPPDPVDVSQASTDPTTAVARAVTSVALLDAQGNVPMTQPLNMVVAPGDTVAFNAGAITFGFS